MKKNKILLTGGAGYIGSMLSTSLVNNNYNITVLDNFMFSQTSLNHLCDKDNFNIINGDIRDESLIKRLIKEHDIIIPLAAYVGAPLCNSDPIGSKSVNYDAIKLMLKNISNNQMILMPTTNSAYGSGDANNYCDEESPLNPISSYAKDKVEVEKMLMDRKNSISFRLATVFGMSYRMRLDLLVNDFTYRAFNDKFLILFESNFKRNYVHIKDVTDVFFYEIKNFENIKNQIFNVGFSEANISKFDLCNLIKNHISDFYFVDAPVGKDIDQRNYIVSNKKMEKFGFKAKKNLDYGIKELIKGFEMIKDSKYRNI